MLQSVTGRKAVLVIACLFLILQCPISAQAVLKAPLQKSVIGQFKGDTSTLELKAKPMFDKKLLSEAQKKLSTNLLQLTAPSLFSDQMCRDNIQQMTNLGQVFLPNGEDQVQEGKVYVYIYLNPDYSTSVVDQFAVEVKNRDENKGLVVAWVAINALESLAAQDFVRVIRPVMPPMLRTGSVTTEGDAIHRTSLIRSAYSQDGTGIKVGIISDGVDARATAQGSGDLPADGAGLTVLSNAVGGEEGTAMLEIVHDMIPGAGLYFHDCGDNVAAFNSAIDDLVSAGCNVICDDIGWLLEPFYEDGTIGSHVSSVIANNDVIYVSSAGNAGDGHYQGNYYASTAVAGYHDFSAGGPGPDYLYAYMDAGDSVIVVLQWNDQFGNSANDYDLGLVDTANPSVWVAGSADWQQGTGYDPLEAFVYTASTAGIYAVVVDKFNGSARNLEVFIYSYGASLYSDNITPVDSIYGHPAVKGALGVGAIDAADPGNDEIEYFSSQGPVTIAYPVAESRVKPDICGVDGVSVTGAGGFPSTFFGTSAAAPHVAAVCGQLWAQYPNKTGNQIRNMVTASAVGLGAAGVDTVFGAGRADAGNAFLFAEESSSVATWPPTDFNGEGKSDLFWRNTSTGHNRLWYMSGSSILAAPYLTTWPDFNWRIKAIGDFNGDGKSDIWWRHFSTGYNRLWFISGGVVGTSPYTNTWPDFNWEIKAAGDFNGDGKCDVWWRHSVLGYNRIWFMNGATLTAAPYTNTLADFDWDIQAAGDFDGDGKTDVWWRNKTNGLNRIWFMNGNTIKSALYTNTLNDSNWEIKAAGDFNGDGKCDVWWRDFSNGRNMVWLMNGKTLTAGLYTDAQTDYNWQIRAAGDFNADGKADIWWRNFSTGQNRLWYMNGGTVTSSPYSVSLPDLDWEIQAPSEY